MADFSKTQLLPTVHVRLMSMQALSYVFGDRIISSDILIARSHPIVILVIFSSGVVRRKKFTTVTLER
jgi:hypothetical protein